ncbi:hypothetical protein N665_0030s0099 [Sinapis alba]|nr:hypothetical protein N665_0030s0099 [Sinapis alba]
MESKRPRHDSTGEAANAPSLGSVTAVAAAAADLKPVANASPLGLVIAAHTGEDAGDNAELKPAANASSLVAAHTGADAGDNTLLNPGANPPPLGLGIAAHPGVVADSDDDLPEELSNEEAIVQNLHLDLSIEASAPFNPFPLIRSLETFDDWNSEDYKRYFDHLCYEKGHRYLKQFERDYIQTYASQNPQGRHIRF